MTIESMLHGHMARADEDGLNIIRKCCEEMINIAMMHPGFQPLIDQLEDQIAIADTNIEGLRREDRIAEQSARYREDRPNA